MSLPKPLPRSVSDSADRVQAWWANLLERPGTLLTLLFLLCAVPRLLMAGVLDEVCDDAYYYISAAHSLGEGDYSLALSYLNLNIYPVILLSLHQLGLEWVLAGKLWGVLVSSLTVLPLFGWVRRLFDDRVAAAACFLYAVHGNLIEFSVEPIRESTFWLAMTLCLYLTRRAVTERRMILFALSGLALSVALHTRTEAWLLLLPVGGWMLIEAIRRSEARPRLLAGGIVSFAAAASVVLVFNLTVLRGHDRWEFGKFHHFQVAWTWLQSQGEAVHPLIASAASTGEASPQIHALVQTASAGWPALAAECLKDLIRAVEPLHVWMLLAGLIVFRQTLPHPEKAVVILGVPALLGAIWIRLSYFGDMNSRYFLTVLFLCLPYMGLGLVVACRWCVDTAERMRPGRQPALAAGALLLTFVGIGWIDALIDSHPKRAMQADMGRWLHQRLDSPEHVAADYPATRLGYFAAGDVPELTSPHPFLQLTAEDEHPDLVILGVGSLGAGDLQQVLEHAEAIGFERIGTDEFPRLSYEYCVLAPVDLVEPPRMAADALSERR